MEKIKILGKKYRYWKTKRYYKKIYTEKKSWKDVMEKKIQIGEKI